MRHLPSGTHAKERHTTCFLMSYCWYLHCRSLHASLLYRHPSIEVPNFAFFLHHVFQALGVSKPILVLVNHWEPQNNRGVWIGIQDAFHELFGLEEIFVVGVGRINKDDWVLTGLRQKIFVGLGMKGVSFLHNWRFFDAFDLIEKQVTHAVFVAVAQQFFGKNG